MPPTANISEAEWEVMEILWRKSPLTALEVVRQLNHKAWKDQTIRTMLGRLVRKKVLTYRADGKLYHYRPLVTRDHCVRVESHSFLHRIFRGAPQPLLVHMVQDAKLSREDIAELRRLLAKKEKK